MHLNKKNLILTVSILFFTALIPVRALALDWEESKMALNLGTISFLANEIEKSGISRGFFMGIEEYIPVSEVLELGAELGYASSTGSTKVLSFKVDTETVFIPIEVNAKYLLGQISGLKTNAGLGLSYNYVKETATVTNITVSENDFLFGFQAFIESVVETEDGFLGLFAKYQATEEFQNYGYNYSNLRFGFKLGWFF